MTVELWKFEIDPQDPGSNCHRMKCQVAAPSFQEAWALVLKDVAHDAKRLKAKQAGLVQIARK